MGLQLSPVRYLMFLVEAKGLFYALNVFVVAKIDCLTDVETMRKTTVVGLFGFFFTFRKVTT